ncbi:hypothetical protein [Actinomadura sp. 9N215]|uniref:hypothetical protein n=1 Tax=Actinomadura sp. 9N215 TaxID=3375150 RepID=UPI003792ED3E
MNRDEIPDVTTVTLQTMEALSVANRASTAAVPGSGGDTSRAAMIDYVMGYEPLRELWARITPEAVRDALSSAARIAVKAGVTTSPENENADTLLTMVRAVLVSEPDHLIVNDPPQGPPRTPPHVFASSLAFDRLDPDDVTLRVFAVLSVLRTRAMMGQPGGV